MRLEASEPKSRGPAAGEQESALAAEQALSRQLLKEFRELPLTQATRLGIEIAVGTSVASVILATVALIISLR
jgi:hypothetical protein